MTILYAGNGHHIGTYCYVIVKHMVTVLFVSHLTVFWKERNMLSGNIALTCWRVAFWSFQQQETDIFE